MKAVIRFLKDFAKEFWKGTTIKTSETVSFELGGFVICIWIVLGVLWLLGLI